MIKKKKKNMLYNNLLYFLLILSDNPINKVMYAQENNLGGKLNNGKKLIEPPNILVDISIIINGQAKIKIL